MEYRRSVYYSKLSLLKVLSHFWNAIQAVTHFSLSPPESPVIAEDWADLGRVSSGMEGGCEAREVGWGSPVLRGWPGLYWTCQPGENIDMKINWLILNFQQEFNLISTYRKLICDYLCSQLTVTCFLSFQKHCYKKYCLNCINIKNVHATKISSWILIC